MGKKSTKCASRLIVFLALLVPSVARAMVVSANNQTSLVNNLKSDTTIELGADIYLVSSGDAYTYWPENAGPTGVIIDEGQTGLVIDGMGIFKMDGQSSVRCIFIQGASVVVTIRNLVIVNGTSTNYVGAGLFIVGATVDIAYCEISGHSTGGIVAMNTDYSDGRKNIGATVNLESSVISENRRI